MEQYISRQPIFDAHLGLLAYELLCFGNECDVENQVVGAELSVKQLVKNTITDDATRIAADKVIYVDYTDRIINDRVELYLDSNRMVVEVSSEIAPTDKVFAAIDNIRKLGYKIALDKLNVVFPEEKLLRLANIVKIDFRTTTSADRRVMLTRLASCGVELLALNVKDRSEYQEAIAMGFNLFQGFFFASPTLISSAEMKSISLNHIRLIGELFAEKPSFDALTNIVESDVNMSYKLLKLINSAAFYRRNKIKNINQALVILGLKELRKWATLIMLEDNCQDKPEELVRVAIIRAKMMETIAHQQLPQIDSQKAFLVGLMSLIDVMMERPMEKVLEELPLDDEIGVALMNRKNVFGILLRMIELYEQSSFEGVRHITEGLNLSGQKLPFIYFEALEWAELLAKDL